MKQQTSRRHILKVGSTALALNAAALLPGCGHKAKAAKSVRSAWDGSTTRPSGATITVISQQPDIYCGWPTLARRKNGQLLLAWSGGREGHICPFGRVDFMTSNDDGKTWSQPRTLLDTLIDDRDAGVLETRKGSILVTTFTSLAYEPSLVKAEQAARSGKPIWPEEKLQRWVAARDKLTAEQRKAALGVWMLRSTDGGKTWSKPYDTIYNSPHGPIQLSDGRLLYPGKELWSDAKPIGVAQSTDDGATWQRLSVIPTRPGDDVTKAYHELHGVETADGRIVVHIRNHNKTNAGETLQCESSDGGKTWSQPHAIGVWGLPSHLMRMRDGRLLMTYGHRRKPFGNQARISENGGRTWSAPILVSDDAAGGDLGYPSTVQLGNGDLLTVWYELPAGSHRAVLRQARWRV